MDAVKRRLRAGTGRCQGGYCLTRIVEILRQEYGQDLTDISLRGQGSELFSGRVK